MFRSLDELGPLEILCSKTNFYSILLQEYSLSYISNKRNIRIKYNLGSCNEYRETIT